MIVLILFTHYIAYLQFSSGGVAFSSGTSTWKYVCVYLCVYCNPTSVHTMEKPS